MAIIGRFVLWFKALGGRPEAVWARAEALSARKLHCAAFPLFAQVAQTGVAAAQRRVGECYLRGEGVPPNVVQALRWLQLAATADDAPAQTQLASIALQGARAPALVDLFSAVETVTPDFDDAERWSRRADKAGSPDASALLGLILTAGPADHRDTEAGMRCFRRAAERGSARGRLGLATALLRDGTLASAREANDLLLAIADEHIPAANFLSGVLAETGAAAPPDYEAAAEAYHAAAEQGLPAAQFRYGLALLSGRGIPRDPFTAETWLRRAANSGEPNAAAAIGDMYATADAALAADFGEAAAWYERAAEAGHVGAARQLGRAYLHGTGVPRDVHLAAHWLRMAIRGVDVMAQVDMAPLSLARLSSESDQRLTASWFQDLADAGNQAGRFNLGLCYSEGIGVARDDAQAQSCFQEAADAVPAARERLDQVTASA